jgi:hypothetical protein
MGQVRAYRSISTRRQKALVIQIVREMDHRWPKLDLGQSIIRLVGAVETYCANWPLNELLINRKCALLFDPGSKEILDLASIATKTTSKELALILQVLPEYFKKMDRLISDTALRPQQGAQRDAVIVLRQLFARAAHELLNAKRAEFHARQRAASQLRQFIFDLEDWDFRRRLFGFSKGQISLWKKEQRKLHIQAQTRERVARHRAKKAKK